MTKQELLKKADEYKNQIDAYRPFSVRQQEELEHYLKLAYYEAEGQGQAYDYILALIKIKPLEISEEIIRKMHELSSPDKVREEAGQYRRIHASIPDTGKQYPSPEELQHLMEHFINQMQNSRRLLHSIEFAAICHKRLMDIHPFKEGNGRVARLLMNLILVNAGYGMASIHPTLRSDYINALNLSRGINNPDIDALTGLIAGCVIESEKDFCRLLEGTVIS